MSKSPIGALSALISSLAVFGIGSMMRQWTIWKIDGCCGVGTRVSLWKAIDHLSRDGEGQFWSLHERDVITTFTLLTGAIGIGLGVYWLLTRRGEANEVGDYRDGENGLVQDGSEA